MSSPAYPLYVNDLGDGMQCAEIPAAANGCSMFSFFVDADHDTMQALVDKYLNTPAGGAVEYYVVGSAAIFTWSYTARDVSLVQQAGYSANSENGIWIPVLARSPSKAFEDHIAYFVPYLFITGCGGMITGREVWGFRKSLATIQMPHTPDEPALFATTTDVIDPLDNEHGAHPEMVIQVRGAGKLVGLDALVRDVREIGAMFMELFGKGSSHLPVGRLGLVIDFARMMRSHEVPIVNLKQFRDAADTTRACYQAIIESSMTAGTVHQGGLLAQDFLLDLPRYASHRIAGDLGITGVTDIPVRAAFYVNMDFVANAGEEVWRAS